jgi:hypothetical protein
VNGGVSNFSLSYDDTSALQMQKAAGAFVPDLRTEGHRCSQLLGTATAAVPRVTHGGGACVPVHDSQADYYCGGVSRQDESPYKPPILRGQLQNVSFYVSCAAWSACSSRRVRSFEESTSAAMQYYR